MSLMLQKLNNIRSLRAMSREFSIDVLEEMLEKLRVVTEEKRSEQQSALQQQAEYQEKINTWLELMIADGITPDELVTQNAGPSKETPAASGKISVYRFFRCPKNLDRPGAYAEADRPCDCGRCDAGKFSDLSVSENDIRQELRLLSDGEKITVGNPTVCISKRQNHLLLYKV